MAKYAKVEIEIPEDSLDRYIKLFIKIELRPHSMNYITVIV